MKIHTNKGFNPLETKTFKQLKLSNKKFLMGFTLIELLIVVAIIAILAAIAIPNYLMAQTRAKVSRVMAEERTIATAMETYIVDNNSYPCTCVCEMLSTPIAYLTSIPNDPFSKGEPMPYMTTSILAHK